MDDKGDHILVDEDYNITGIIDWTFARLVPIYEAFGPSLLTAEMSDIYESNAGRSRGDTMLAEAVQTKSKHLHLVRFAGGPDLVRRFSFGLGMGMDISWDEAVALFRGIMSTAEGSSLEFDWDVWRQNRLSQRADDARLQALLLKLGEI
ncbi:unnamed protein product [Penicillium egyptiacum]|uniref:Aminoglycoside phosphotransferase domain-containing protein n=1 Tax=Penicillium egyptiacum TaxID=1303716 RepID=A0A9W4KAM8_9EURO|nr:unnamed protein product [Penicillium egyptiacum]